MKPVRGFTLLEVLVALVLVGLLMMVLFGGFRAGIRSWHASERHAAQVEEPRQISSLLYRHLGQLLPVTFAADESGMIEPAFLGEANRIRYVAPLSMSAGGMPYVFELVSGWQGREGLWVRYAPYIAGRSAAALLQDSAFVQLSPALQATFAYFGVAEAGAEPAWHEAYLNAKEPPRLVSLRLSGDEQPWPHLTFAVVQLSKNEGPPALRFVR